jgi:hypothetical protein
MQDGSVAKPFRRFLLRLCAFALAFAKLELLACHAGAKKDIPMYEEWLGKI